MLRCSLGNWDRRSTVSSGDSDLKKEGRVAFSLALFFARLSGRLFALVLVGQPGVRAKAGARSKLSFTGTELGLFIYRVCTLDRGKVHGQSLVPSFFFLAGDLYSIN